MSLVDDRTYAITKSLDALIQARDSMSEAAYRLRNCGFIDLVTELTNTIGELSIKIELLKATLKFP